MYKINHNTDLKRYYVLYYNNVIKTSHSLFGKLNLLAKKKTKKKKQKKNKQKKNKTKKTHN